MYNTYTLYRTKDCSGDCYLVLDFTSQCHNITILNPKSDQSYRLSLHCLGPGQGGSVYNAGNPAACINGNTTDSASFITEPRCESVLNPMVDSRGIEYSSYLLACGTAPNSTIDSPSLGCVTSSSTIITSTSTSQQSSGSTNQQSSDNVKYYAIAGSVVFAALLISGALIWYRRRKRPLENRGMDIPEYTNNRIPPVVTLKPKYDSPVVPEIFETTRSPHPELNHT